MKIELTIGKHVPPNQWLNCANKMVKNAAAQHGKEFWEVDAIVYLPERGRCFTKGRFDFGFTAHG